MTSEHETGEFTQRKPGFSRQPEECASPSSELIAQGDLLLARLKFEAAAARAEAKKAKLEVLLEHAKSGDRQAVASLKQWMLDEGELTDGFGSPPSGDAMTAIRVDAPHAQGLAPDVTPTKESPASQAEFQQPKRTIDTWDQLLPFAQARVDARQAKLRDPALGTLSGLDPSQLSPFPSGEPDARQPHPILADPVTGRKPDSQVEFDRPLVDTRGFNCDPENCDPENCDPENCDPENCDPEPKPTESSDSTPNRGRTVTETQTERSSALETAASPKKKQVLLEIATSLGSQQQQEEQKQHHREVALFSGLGGVISSLLAHVLLLVILAWVTLKLPPPPAGMAFESSSVDVAEETFELTQPLEVDVADEVTEPVPAATPALDAASEMAELGPMISENATDFVSTMGSLANSAAAAQSAVTAATSAMNASASFFGAAAGGNSFCYVIDGSASMRGGPWQAAKLELLKSLASLKPTQRFYIIFFNRNLEAITLPGESDPASYPLYATPDNLQHAQRWVDSLTIGVGAPPNKALVLAISKEPDAIYLLTDGVTTVDVAAFLRTENRVTDLIHGEQVLVPIHAIAFYSLEGQELLRNIARENQGQFVYVPDPSKR